MRPQATTIVVLLGVTCGAVGQEHRYSVTVIEPLPGHSSVLPMDINNRGEVVGISRGSPINNQGPFIYRPGQGAEALPFPPGHAFSVATAINDEGVVVGYSQSSWIAEQAMVGWKYENGQFTMVPSVSTVNGINSAGMIVGRSCLSGTSFTCYFRIAPGGVMQDVGAAGFYTSSMWRLVSINDGGQILCTAPALDAAYRVEPDGGVTTLPLAPRGRTYTWAVNNNGLCLARYEYCIQSQCFSDAFIWTPETGVTFVGIPERHVRGKGMNNLGHVVGESGGNFDSFLHTWVWTPERGAEDLAPLIDPAWQIVPTYTYDINDNGQILGGGTTLLPPARSISYVLTPVTACTADFNGDGQVDFFDYLDFVQAFANEDPEADFNGDGQVDFFDYLDFVQAFAEGCD